MRPRTRRDGRNRSGLRAIRGGCFGTARHIGDRPAGYGANGTHRFIPGASCSVAYADRPASIGRGQTISQPLIVALMTHFAEVKFDHTVLEVGTGSGYQAAILAQLVRKVCTIEIIPSLAEAAAKLLRNLGYDNVNVKIGDGYYGWPECGPFDAMIVTAAREHVPPPLVEQLKVGGPTRDATGGRPRDTAAYCRREDRSG
jgi:protein-L-isoaspartate O-methyltransferase